MFLYISVKELQATSIPALSKEATVGVNVHQRNVSGKLQEQPEALPDFTIEHVTQYLIYRKEQDNL